MKPWFSRTLPIVAIALLAAPAVHAQGILGKLKKAVTKEYTVRGRVRVHDGQWLTCFDGIKTGYLGAADMSRPGDAKTDPATGRMQVSTAAIPAIIRTRQGIVTSNDCDSLAEQGLLLPPVDQTRKGDTGYSDPYGCTKPEWTSDEIIARRREIMECQSEAITERAWQRSRERAAGGNATTAGGTTTTTTDTAALAAKFKAIGAQAATPSTAPAPGAAALAADGAKVCGLKAPYMLELRGQAVAFVRYDAAKGVIVMSEMAGGERKEVPLDGNAFAQRVSFNAQAIGQGGDTCGRAFWNAEAYKAATAAITGR
jgi:hypothetical protein